MATESIRIQIIQAIVDVLTAQVNSPAIGRPQPRGVEWIYSLAATAKQTPWWQVYAEAEHEVPGQKTTQGRTYEFPIFIKVIVSQPKDLAREVDRHCAAVQALMEADIQLDGLASIIDGGGVEFFVDEQVSNVGVALVSYTVLYRRKLGDPYSTF